MKYIQLLKQETMENKYKIRNFPGVKIESVGIILTEKDLIERFNTGEVEYDIEALLNMRFIEKVVTKEVISEVQYLIRDPYGIKLVGKRGDYSEQEILDIFSNDVIVFKDIDLLKNAGFVEAFQYVNQVELKQDSNGEV